MKTKLGLRSNARSPGSITNIQHNDGAGANKNLNGSAGAVESIVVTSTTKTPIGDEAVVRVANTTASFQYVYIGPESTCPVGAPDITNGLAVAPNSVDVFFGEISTNDKDSVVVKTSSASVQVAILKR